MSLALDCFATLLYRQFCRSRHYSIIICLTTYWYTPPSIPFERISRMTFPSSVAIGLFLLISSPNTGSTVFTLSHVASVTVQHICRIWGSTSFSNCSIVQNSSSRVSYAYPDSCMLATSAVSMLTRTTSALFSFTYCSSLWLMKFYSYSLLLSQDELLYSSTSSSTISSSSSM